MSYQSNEDRIIFDHKTGENLQCAICIHNRARRNHRSLNDDEIEAIESAKYLFREFLELVVNGKYPRELPPNYQLPKLREAFSKSDFDWTDREKYIELQKWFCGRD